MNKDNAKDFLPLIQALADGKTIQYACAVSGWIDKDELSFGGDPSHYRVKPEPRVIYVNTFSDNSCKALLTSGAAKEHATTAQLQGFKFNSVAKKFIEVME